MGGNKMKKLLMMSLVSLFLLFGSLNSMATVIDGPNIGGYGTFQDENTGRIWLDMDSFFGMNTTDMVTAASAAGFTFATRTDVEQLLNSLPLTGGEWLSYKAIMGDAPARELIWGSYFETTSKVGWAWAYDFDNNWQIVDSSYDSGNMNWNSIPNLGTDFVDMNIWAYQSGSTPVPEPMTLLLLGAGLAGLAGIRKKMK
jgi:hypothetical protein